MRPVEIVASGLVSAVGCSARAAALAWRAGIAHLRETRFLDDHREPILGAEVQAPYPGFYVGRLAQLLLPALDECLRSVGLEEHAPTIPTLLALCEDSRPGRPDHLAVQLREIMALVRGPACAGSRVFETGSVGGVEAIETAEVLLHEGGYPLVLVAGVDSFLRAPTLFELRDRIRAGGNLDGFFPGEAGAAILLAREGWSRAAGWGDGPRVLICRGTGRGFETGAYGSGRSLTGRGLADAIRAATSDAGVAMADLQFRMADIDGGQYGFKEAAMALLRVMRHGPTEFPLEIPAKSVGAVGAASVAVALGLELAAIRAGVSAPRQFLFHVGNDSGERRAMVVTPDVQGTTT